MRSCWRGLPLCAPGRSRAATKRWASLCVRLAVPTPPPTFAGGTAPFVLGCGADAGVPMSAGGGRCRVRHSGRAVRAALYRHRRIRGGEAPVLARWRRHGAEYPRALNRIVRRCACGARRITRHCAQGSLSARPTPTPARRASRRSSSRRSAAGRTSAGLLPPGRTVAMRPLTSRAAATSPHILTPPACSSSTPTRRAHPTLACTS